jgi:3'-5' exoribonuclease
MVKDLTATESVVFFAMIQEGSVRKTKTQKDYISLTLCDKTGSISTKMWDPPPDTPIDAYTTSGTVVKVQAKIAPYNGELQATVIQMRVANEFEYKLEDLVRMPNEHPDNIFAKLIKLLEENLKGEDLNLASHILDVYGDAVSRAPAAKGKHHAYIGGLIEHVYSTLQKHRCRSLTSWRLIARYW